MTSIRLVSLALGVTAACATAREPPGPPPFQGVKRVALVRWREAAAASPRDPLDALKESLEARGYETRVVDVRRRVDDALRPVQRLHERMGSLTGRGGRRTGRDRVERVGSEAGAATRALGVDAVVLYHRSEDLGLRPLPEPPDLARPGLSPPVAFARPLGALSIVSASGAAVSFEWGAQGDAIDADPSAPLNAAEAIEGILRVLSGGDEGG